MFHSFLNNHNKIYTQTLNQIFIQVKYNKLFIQNNNNQNNSERKYKHFVKQNAQLIYSNNNAYYIMII